ncbi:MAG: YnbE family lipoprotein [Bdellovibrionaceae bacterium]|nr:YnbE family lipoprotein [Pseudobdellovibrionaceae bacterium]
MKQLVLMFALSMMSWSCSVALQAPDKPLEINLNVKVDHQISVKVDKEVESMMKKNEGIF